MKIAIFGAGQLAMMMVQADTEKKHKYTVIDPSESPPACKYAEHIQTEYTDINTIKKISNDCDLATIDFENVDVSAMKEIEKEIPVYPSSRALEICQDRIKEKDLFKHLEISTTNYCEINSLEDLKNNINNKKSYILKTRRFGYDGKNQYRIYPGTRPSTNLVSSPCILEEFVEFQAEVSLIAVRSVNGTVFFYPLVENRHKDGILDMSIYPSNYQHLQKSAEDIGSKLLDKMNYVGVLVVEFFIDKNDYLVANEMAPRVHNSGHWTIEGSNISQFSAHISAITNSIKFVKLKLKPSFMYNIISNHIAEDKILQLSNKFDMYFHDYHKSSRDKRKLGHITCTVEDKDKLKEKIKEFKSII
ncbi:MAG: 5-(carboxyamino)imidazole ribonucleotide synthase [Gammaproteobacteria bacterium]|nr:5-(carboxyamino)imidazole ribonucleotide synthase [Gammaproteobacteria bacterium]MBL6819597.1 5-(carboxyamino)imidazole ribonucleotide synthase [Gammaproteobacteria bacterium]